MIDCWDDWGVPSNIALNKESLKLDDGFESKNIIIILNVSCLDPGDHDEDGGGGIRSGPAILGSHQSLHLTYEEQMLPR